MAAPQELLQLVEQFDRNADAYRSGRYNETMLRREYVDPLFTLLGWDVDNKQGWAEAYKEVIHEDAIKVGGATKAPDYCFRIGGTRKFFVEAKKPSVNLKDEVTPAFQLRRYAWSAKLPLSILTDFEEFAVYDCRLKPGKDDKPSAGRTLYLTYTDYADRWDEIAAIFSKDAVLQGSFDKYAESGKRKRGTAEVDTAFLDEIEAWRDMVAKNLALRNSGLSTRELNFAVQRTIDRIIFLRICEDRGIELYGQLMSLLNGEELYPRLCEIFRRADERYNSGLFHFQAERGRSERPDDLTLRLSIDDKPLKTIIRSLYYPDSPYEFSVLPADILGQVYEQFLGKVIRLTAGHRAVVEDKPEVKKAGGVYYTPTYIVDYIVKNTVGKLVEGKTPQQVEKLTILDPACGSGSFLIGAYQYLLNWHCDWYSQNDPDKWAKGRNPRVYQGSGGDWRLTTAERKRILLNSIHGVDIDPQAVEVTKLSLLLKVLEGESAETIGSQLRLFHERALPDLGSNIKCGNSLIGPDFYANQQMSFLDDEERYRINAFDWQAEFPEIFTGNTPGFDAVIGNPPYGAELSELDREYLQRHFKVGTTDTAALFMVRQNYFLKSKGIGGFIVPKPFTYASNWEKVRNTLLSSICQVVDVSKVWKEVKLEQIIYLYQKGIITEEYASCLRSDKIIREVGRIQKSRCSQFGFIINGVTGDEIRVADKLRNQECFLNDLVINQRGAMLQKYIIAEKSDFRVLGGKQINRYSPPLQVKGFISEQHVTDEKAFIKPNSILAQNIIAHIQNPFDHIQIIATIPGNEPAVIVDTVNQLQNISNFSSSYLLGILNSHLINWYVYRFIFAKAIRTMHFDSPVTSRIPYPNLNLKKNSHKARHDRMVELVDRMLALHKQLATRKTDHEKTAIQRQIDATDRQIDTLVYELYGLTEEEIAIVDEAGK